MFHDIRYTGMEQHAVPRNISSFQFHLIGDMTLRQFGYMAGGAIVGFVVYKALPVPGPIAFGAAAMCALVGFAFAFVPIQERPLDRWILAFIKSILSPTQYVWHKIPTVPDILLKQSVVRVQALPQVHQEAHHEAREKLNNYLHSLPQTPHQTLNVREKRYVDSTMHLFSTTPSVPAAVFTPTATFNAPAAPPAPPVHSPLEPQKPPAQTQPPVPLHPIAPIHPSPAPYPAPATSSPVTIVPPSALSGGIPINQIRATAPQPRPPMPFPTASAVPPSVPAVAVAPSPPASNLQPVAAVSPEPATPDSSPAQSSGQIGVGELQKPATPQPILVSEPPVPSAPATVAAVSPVQPAVSEQPVQQTPISSELSSLKQQLDALMAEKLKMTEELTRLKQQTEPSPEIIKPVVDKEKPKRPTIKAVSAKAAVDEIGMPTLPQTPNVVVGIIKDGQKKILPNIILTIKDNKGMPLRALKTNKLGQFITATPLPNGTYFLEVEDPLKRYTFDVAEIAMKGEIFLPIEITAKSEREAIREKLAKDLFGST